MNKKNKLYLIAGGTASGKSSIADEIVKNVLDTFGDEHEQKITLLRMDNYYRTIKQLGASSVSEVNWDEPSAYNWDQITSDIENLINGKEVNGHLYDYTIGGYDKTKKFVIKPSKIIVLEGIYALYSKELRDMAFHKTFIYADEEVRKMRRIKRDSSSRYAKTFNTIEFLNKWDGIIKPMHEKYIEPTKEYADIIIENNDNTNLKENTQAISLIHSLMVK